MAKVKQYSIDRVNRVTASVGLVPAFVAMLFMLVVIFIGVFMRYALGQPLPFVDEYVGYALALLTLLTLGYATRTKGHISMDLVVEKLHGRALAGLQLATLIISLGFALVLLVATTKMTIESFILGRRAWSPMETLLGPVQLVMPIGFTFFAIGILAEITARIRVLMGQPEKSQDKAKILKTDQPHSQV